MSDTKPKALLEQAGRDMAGAVSVRLCSLGIELGLFKDLHEHGRSTSAQLAARLQVNERYTLEWLHGIVLSGYVMFDKITREAWLSPDQAQLLVEEGGSFAQHGAFKLLNSALSPYEKLREAFESGGGVGFEGYPPALWQALDHTGCARYRNFLVKDWLPNIPALTQRLKKGAKFADFGCGTGRSTIELANLFPKSAFIGYNAFWPNIQQAGINAKVAGVDSNITFKHWNMEEGSPGQYDIVATFDLIHDLPNPALGLKTLKHSTAKDGMFLLMDIEATEDPIDNSGPYGVFKLGISLHFCMTTSMWQGGEGMGTVGLSDSLLRKLCAEAGFSEVRKIDIKHPLNSLNLIT